jgi:hypothetical protein
MNHVQFNWISVALISATLVGCAADDGVDSPGKSPPASAPSEAAGSAVALRIEQAARSLDRGVDLKEARAALEDAARDPSATPDERDHARIELSRALEAQGDREAAIASIEALLSEHSDGRPWPMESRAEARLRQLVTGKLEAAKPRPRSYSQPPAPFAHVLSKYFPMDVQGGRGAADVRVVAFGGNEEDTKRIGAFDVERALRDKLHETCSLCDPSLSIQGWFTRSSSWVGIPRHRAKLGSAVAVYYMTLGEGRIPARYDAELPMPSAAVAVQLEQGKGLVVARERKGAPPSILIAAPREAQLRVMEEALAALPSLPVVPVTQVLSPSLSSEEIQPVVRAIFGAYKTCYEALLKQDAAASGSFSLSFTIAPSGSVTTMGVQSATGALTDAAFQQCVIAATSALVFPEALEQTTVVYPILMTPGDGSEGP